MKYALAAALAALTLAPCAYASSGGQVLTIQSNTVANPDCVLFQQGGDSTWYGTSLNDPGAPQTLVTLNNARGYLPGVTYVIGDPGPPFHASDCANNGVIYVHDIKR